MWPRDSLQGSRDREIGPSLSLSTFPGILQSCNNKKGGGGGKGEGWNRDTIAGARFGVTTVYLVLILTGGGSCAAIGGGGGERVASSDFEANTWEGGLRLCFWARSSPAPACVTASLRGPRRSSQQVGRGTSRGPKRRRNQSFRARPYLGRRGAGGGGEGRRRQRMTATPRQLANSSGSRRRHRGPHPKRTPARLAGCLS